MMTPFRGAAAAAALILSMAAAQDVRAQQIVHDPTSYAALVEDARTTLQQLRALQTQIEQGEALFDSLNQASGVNALAQDLGLPDVRRALPALSALRAAAEGDLSGLGRLADRADAIRRETRLYGTPAGELSGTDAYDRDSRERAGARTARDLAIGEAIDESVSRRQDGLQALQSAIDGAPNARAVMDLQARLAIEQALIQNEQIRLQGLALTQAAEERLERQRERERAAEARDRRMLTYRRQIP